MLNNFFNDLESVALVAERSDIVASEDCYEPTASCINDTKKRHLVTRSGLSRLRWCVSHIHHKWAMNSPGAVREFLGTVLQHVCHLKVDVIAGDANAAAYKYYKKKNTKFFSSHQLPSCSERCNVKSTWDSHLKIGFTSIILPITIRLSFTQRVVVVASERICIYHSWLSQPL